jgi:gamma-glutamyl:cysteine ligase YbdK (ATP-grasp superfamily)
MSKVLYGPELELTVIDENGNLSNRASSLVSAVPDENVALEIVETMLEVHCKPSSSISILHDRLTETVSNIIHTGNKMGIRLAPCSTITADKELEVFNNNYYHAMLDVLGDSGRESLKHFMGTHVHIDIGHDKEEIMNQYTLATAMDPAFAFMSSTPFYFGKSEFKDYRLFYIRNQTFNQHAPLGKLVPYQTNFSDLENYFKKSYNWLHEKFGALPYPVPKVVDTAFRAHWGGPRLKLDEDIRTLEIRCADANTISNVTAFTALMKGVFTFFSEQQPVLTISEKPEYFAMNARNGIPTLSIPSYDKLLDLECAGYKHGFASEEIFSYCSNIFNIAEQGLKLKERKFLNPFKKMLETRKNYSDTLIDFVHTHGFLEDGKLDPKEVSTLRLQSSRDFVNDVEGNVIATAELPKNLL